MTLSLASKTHIRVFDTPQAYLPTYQAMQQFTANRTADTDDALWFLEHEPVYTLGRNAKREHLLNTGEIPVIDIDRGGEVTYHGTGQQVVYCLLDLKRLAIGVKTTVNRLEHAMLATLAHFGIKANLLEGSPGVYVSGQKIGALGLRVKNGCTYHGLSLNIDMDLTPFAGINPCGHVQMPSVDMHTLNPDATLTHVRPILTQFLLESLYAA